MAWIGSHHTFATEATSWADHHLRHLRARRTGYLSTDRRSLSSSHPSPAASSRHRRHQGHRQGHRARVRRTGANVRRHRPSARGRRGGGHGARRDLRAGGRRRGARSQAVAAETLGAPATSTSCVQRGRLPDAKLEDMTDEDIDADLATNVKGTMLAVKACMATLERSGHGTSSSPRRSPARSPASRVVPLGATKAAQLGFLARGGDQLAPRGSRSTRVMPRNIVTEDFGGSAPGIGRRSRPRSHGASSAKVEDIGYAALFLATDEPPTSRAETIVVDGGRSPSRVDDGDEDHVIEALARPTAPAARDRLQIEVDATRPGNRLRDQHDAGRAASA